jgi:hypothetical protein
MRERNRRRGGCRWTSFAGVGVDRKSWSRVGGIPETGSREAMETSLVRACTVAKG